MQRTRSFLVVCILTVGATAAAGAQSTAARSFSRVEMAPNGASVAWTGPVSAGESGGSGAAIASAPRWTPTSVEVPGAAAGSASEVAWSPDGKTLAVLARTSGGTPAVYRMRAASHALANHVEIRGTVHDLHWSPDGTHMALLYTSAAEEGNSPVAATPRDTGSMDVHVDRQHLAVIDASTGAFKLLSPADRYIYEYDWSPDGRQIVVSEAPGSGNNNWWVARLALIDAATGRMREIAKPATQLAEPRFSPDGRSIAYIGGLMSDQGVTGGDLYVLPSTGGVARDVTKGIHSSIASFSWTGPSTLLTTGYAQGKAQIARLDVRSGALVPVWSGEEQITTGGGPAAVSATPNGQVVATVRQSFAAPPEVWVGAPGRWTQVTYVNDKVRPAAGKAVNVQWKSGPYNVQGFLVYPADFVAGKKYPMIVQVHGGPSSAVTPRFLAPDAYEALESNRGYFVFLPNPRGSYGQGEAFTRANVRDFGYGDLRDIMAGVDAVIARYPVDSARMGIQGWSYGGFMTMWAVTQTNRFKAAVAGAGISNWLSYTGENGISEWMVPFFGATAYEDKAVYDKSSPINYIDHAKTPTLIVVGERDAECPAPQSFEFWRGLQHAHVATQLVVYPDEGHHFVQPEHVRDVHDRTVGWMDRYLKAGATP